MIEIFAFWVWAAAAFALGWAIRARVAESGGYGQDDLDLAYAQGVADERAASRKRGQELAEAIDIKQQAPYPGHSPYTGHWPQ